MGKLHGEWPAIRLACFQEVEEMWDWVAAIDESILVREKPWALLCWGAPAAGKSTLARQLAQDYGVPRLSSDEVNQALIGDDFRSGLRVPIYRGLLAMSEALLIQGERLVLDGTFLDDAARAEVAALAQARGAVLVSVHVLCPLTERLQRNRSRPDSRRVDEDWLRRAHQRAQRSRGSCHLTLDTTIVSVGEAVELVKACLQARLRRHYGLCRKPWRALPC